MADQWDQYLVPGSRSLADQNNNPGNLRFAGQAGATPGKGGFAQFPDPDSGMNALRRQIDLNAGRGMTLGQHITSYAPPSENDTASYIRQASQATGATPDTPLTQLDRTRLASFQAQLESGHPVASAGEDWDKYVVPNAQTPTQPPQGGGFDPQNPQASGINTSALHPVSNPQLPKGASGMFPPVPMAPPGGSQSDAQMGSNVVGQMARGMQERIAQPAKDIATGVNEMRQGQGWQGAADAARGGLDIGTAAMTGPLVNAAYVAPIKTTLGALTSMASSWLAGKGAAAMGANEPQQELASDVGALLPGVAALRRIGQKAPVPSPNALSNKTELYQKMQQQSPGDITSQIPPPPGAGPLERLQSAADAKSYRASEYSAWDKSISLSQQAAGMAANTPDAIANRIMAIGASKQLVPEAEWGHAVGEPPGGTNTRTEKAKLEDVIDYLQLAAKKAWDRFDQNYLQPAQNAHIQVNATGVPHDVMLRVNPELVSSARFADQARANIDMLNHEYTNTGVPGSGNSSIMTPQTIQARVSNLNDLEYGVFQKNKVGAMNTLDTNVQLAFIDAERQVLLDKLIDATAGQNVNANPDVARLERRQYGSITQLRNEALNQLANASGVSQNIPRRALGFMMRAGVEAGMGQTRGAAANVASSIATAIPQQNAGSLFADAFKAYQFPYQLPELPGPFVRAGNAQPLPPRQMGVVPTGPQGMQGPPSPTGFTMGSPNISAQVGPQLPPGAPGAPPQLPPGVIPKSRQLPPALPTGGPHEMPGQTVIPMPGEAPSKVSGPMPGQGNAIPIVDPETGEVRAYSSQAGKGMQFTDTPPGPYKLGDKRKINGTTYIRDLNGRWHPQHTLTEGSVN